MNTTNIPKFASFRPKPKAASEQPREPQQHGRAEQTSTEKRRHEKASPPPVQRIREKDASAASKPYFSDRRGDADVLRYGTLNRYDIPPYRRYGQGFILGLSLQQKIDRELTTDRKIYLSPATHKRKRRLLASKSANRSAERTLRLVQISGNAPDLDQDFVPLSANGKRKRSESDDEDNEDDATPEIDYRGIGEPKSAEPADPDTQFESDAEITINTETTRINSKLVRYTKDHPEDVSGWLALIAHQEAMLKLERPSSQLTASDNVHLADVRISMYGEALKKIGGDSKSQLILYKGLLKEAEKAWDGAKLASKWKDVLANHPDDINLWKMYLNFVQSRFTNFRYEDCRAVFFECFDSLRASTKEILPTDLLHILLRLTSMACQAGYQELSIAIWQALLESRIFRPEGAATVEIFEAFWDSEVPRIGELQAKGWKNHSSVEEPVPTQYSPLMEKSHSDPFFEDFQKREAEAMRRLILPGRTSDNVAEDDAFHTIFYDDLAPYMKRLSENVHPTLLVEAFLCFCGLPPLPTLGAHQRDWWSDPFLQCHWSPSPPNKGEPFKFAQMLERFSCCPLESFQMTTELLFDQNFATNDIGLDIDFIRRVLKLLAADTSSDEVFGEYLLAFELRHYPQEAFKTAKRLLKGRPSSLRLYNAYGLVEARLGNSDKADQVFRTVLSMQSGKSQIPSPQILGLLNSWAWEALHREDGKVALWRLVSPHGNIPASFAESQPDQDLVSNTRLKLEEISERALLGQDHVTAILSTSLSALLLYLANDYDAEHALELHSHLSIWFTSHNANNTPFAELHAQFMSRLLTYHIAHAPIVKPAFIRTALEPLISRFPDNTILLSLYAANEARFSIDDRVRAIMHNTTLQSQEERSVAGWAFAIHYETLRGETAGSTSHSIRALYKRATASSGEHCPALWKAYVQFELLQLQQLQESRRLGSKKPRRDGKKSKAEVRLDEATQRLKDTFYSGLRNLPWCKGYVLLAFTEAKHVFSDEEKWKLCRVMVEKEMRLYVELDDDGAWETAHMEGWVADSAMTYSALKTIMEFGFSPGDVVLAAQFLYKVGKALSDAHGAPKQVKEDTAFLDNLIDTLGSVLNAIDDGLVPDSVRKKIEAIQGPLLEKKDKMAEYMDLTRPGERNLKDIVTRPYKKIKYCQYFTEKVKELRETVAIPLDGLHVDLTLFSLGRLQTTREAVEKRLTRNQQTHEQGLLRSIKEWLRPISAIEDTYNTTVANLLSGTCEWLFKLNQDKRTVAYFFCDGTAQRDDVRGLMATLCWQLLNQFPEDAELLSQAYYKGGEPTETDMKDCLGQMCEKRDAVILLDGLDECTVDTRRRLCMLLTSLASLSNVIVLSRELEDIQKGLSRVPEPFGLARIRISEFDTTADLEKLIIEEAKQLGVSDEETRREIVRRLHAECHGMFQWATNMIAYLMDSDCMFDDDFLSKTEEMPTGLHDLYSKILNNIHQGKSKEMINNSLCVLNWVACSRRALSLSEIATMLRVNSGALRHGKAIIAEDAVLRQTISKYCGPLVRFSQQQNREVVILAHASVKEFLLGRAERESEAPVNQKEAEIETELARICFTYLSSDDIESPPFQLTETNEPRAALRSRFQDYLKRYPLMKYATLNLWNHAYSSVMPQILQTTIERFCSSEAWTIRWLQVFLRLRGDRGIWRSSNARSDIRVITKTCNKKLKRSPVVIRWLSHLRGPSHGRFSRWRRFVTSGDGNDFLPALHLAAFFDFNEYVKNELEKGAKPDEPNVDGQTPLHLSARGESMASARILLAHGADVNARGSAGTTPLSWAISNEDNMDIKGEGPFEMAWFLLKHDADPTLGPRSTGEAPAPITLACRIPQPNNPYVLELVEEMLKRGASKHIDGYPGRKPLLTSAVVAKSDQLIDLLLAYGANPNGGDSLRVKEHSKFNHPLIVALRQSPSQLIVKKLLEAGADPNAIGRDGRRALHLSASIMSPQVSTTLTELLIEKGADCNLRSNSGSLPLHDATRSRNLGAMKVLIAKHERSQLDTEDGLGRTPLMIAIEGSFREGTKPTQESPGQTDTTIASYKVVEKQAARFPRNKEDQYRVYTMLRGGSGRSRLPASVARKILDKAEYWIKSASERCEAKQYDQEEAKKQAPYLLGDPIQGAHSHPVREINIIIRSHDQGFSDYKNQHGTYGGSMTFFNVIVQRQDGSLRDIGKGGEGIIHNVHACFETREHFVILKHIPPERRQSWLGLVEPGDRIGVVPMALYRGWVNYVESVRIEVFSTFILEWESKGDA
ncbi:uncharacterized protein yc1106_07559 [Curvularia clavata]|uniref:Nephrocystin 3-like N-terminal domain-containing protein n=1 Tax=Curvularia clavata TaxID=95742 RepID=A0A9Q8ZEJ7_CURCL|nr:uncharacterized protein yc1106_07559 [Curvularia clavata]